MLVNAQLLKGHLDMLLLSVISKRPAHGYQVICDLREASKGVFELPEGTIYPALHRLERAGVLRSRWASGPTRKRRIYELTALGATALAAQRSEWDKLRDGVAATVRWAS